MASETAPSAPREEPWPVANLHALLSGARLKPASSFGAPRVTLHRRSPAFLYTSRVGSPQVPCFRHGSPSAMGLSQVLETVQGFDVCAPESQRYFAWVCTRLDHAPFRRADGSEPICPFRAFARKGQIGSLAVSARASAVSAGGSNGSVPKPLEEVPKPLSRDVCLRSLREMWQADHGTRVYYDPDGTSDDPVAPPTDHSPPHHWPPAPPSPSSPPSPLSLLATVATLDTLATLATLATRHAPPSTPCWLLCTCTRLLQCTRSVTAARRCY